MELENFYGINHQIFNYVAKWKIVKGVDIYNGLKPSVSTRNFNLRLANLVKRGYLITFKDNQLGSGRSKYYSLTESAISWTTNGHYSLIPTRELLNHDLILSKFMKGVSTLVNYHDHEFENMKLTEVFKPDCILYLQLATGIRPFAIEIEITQKEKSRVMKKIAHFEKSTEFAGYIYVFQSYNSFMTYQKYVEEYLLNIPEETRSIFFSKFVFIYLPEDFKSDHVIRMVCMRNRELKIIGDLLSGESLKRREQNELSH